MTDSVKSVRKYTSILIILLPVLSFAVPFLILYFDRQTTILYYSFDMTWKGRTFYIFFLWLASLEIILEWNALQSVRAIKLRSARTIILILALSLPTIYLVASNYYGFPSRLIIDRVWQLGGNTDLYQPDWIPLDLEYFVLAALFVLIVWLQFGGKGLKKILIAPIFLTTIGAVYTIDNIYRNGSFTPFQILVPMTATLAANVLNFLGYHTTLSGGMPSLVAIGPHGGWGAWIATLSGTSSGMPSLVAIDPHGTWAAFSIAWPCSGVESLLIYTVTILLFLKNSAFSWKQRTAYFVFGAAITYFINILRIAAIFILAINAGGSANYAGSEAQQFHDFYGQLYSIIWIVSYPLIIIGSQVLWERFRNRKIATQVHLDSINDPGFPR